MSRLRLLNDTINGITTEAGANTLVKKWLPHQAHDIDHGAFACAPGVRNCSLIAEFVLTYINMGIIEYGKLCSATPTTVASPYTALAFTGGQDTDAMHVSIGGHEMAILREGTLYAFYQAWEGRFHVFPRLNPGNASHNSFGDGDAALLAMRTAISAACGTTAISERKGHSNRG
ncbi:MAG: hypothetical protein V4582_24045 [Pseudomonadota bacterium]